MRILLLQTDISDKFSNDESVLNDLETNEAFHESVTIRDFVNVAPFQWLRHLSRIAL